MSLRQHISRLSSGWQAAQRIEREAYGHPTRLLTVRSLLGRAP
jgi:hypothetical protein